MFPRFSSNSRAFSNFLTRWYYFFGTICDIFKSLTTLPKRLGELNLSLAWKQIIKFTIKSLTFFACLQILNTDNLSALIRHNELINSLLIHEECTNRFIMENFITEAVFIALLTVLHIFYIFANK